jgi:hypothetical protein
MAERKRAYPTLSLHSLRREQVRKLTFGCTWGRADGQPDNSKCHKTQNTSSLKYFELVLTGLF